ncbi:MAG: CheR family methyltransferase [Cellvibrionaceae bacterium]
MSASESLKNDDFVFLQDLIYKKTGIVIGDHKKEMIYRRLSKRMRDLNIELLDDYCNILRSDSDQEMNNFINAVTTNLTSFFRENHHFEYLKDEFLPGFMKKGGQRFRIWSSACSTGEEPYSIAMTMRDAFGKKIKNIDAKLLATDLDTQVIRTAKNGLYDANRLKDLPSNVKSKWFSEASVPGKYCIDPSLKELITFNKLNLLGPWPMRGEFDVIFCRNVLIYFDKPTQEKLVKRFYDVLKVGGALMLGHSESVLKGSDDFDHLGKTIYVKRAL